MAQISVIVPVYKVEPYLHRCIDSIIGQKFKDFELILVDDGSPDNCGKICDEYAEKDSRIVVIHQENGGLSAARNAGLDWVFSNSDSEWIAFVDSDDYIDLDWLEILYKSASSNDAEIVVTSFKKCIGDNIKYFNIEFLEVCLLTQADKFNYIFRLLKHDGFGWEACTRIYKKSLLLDNGLLFHNVFAEDMLFNATISLYATKICHVDYCGYNYTIGNPDSIMTNSIGKIRVDAMNEISYGIYPFIKSKLPDFFPLFPVIHFLMCNNQYSRISSSFDYNKMPELIGSISRQEWYKEQTSELKKCKKYMIKKFSHYYTEKALCFADCVVSGKWNNYLKKIRWIDRKYNAIHRLMFWR